MKSRVSRYVEKKRKLLKMSQTDLCSVLGLASNGQFASNVERGICQWPDKYLPSICRVLKISRYELAEYYLADRKEEYEKLFKE